MPHIDVVKKVKARVPRQMIDRAFRLIKKQQKQKSSVGVSLAIVSPSEIRRLNKQYRRKDKVTDVLSFTDAEDTAYLGDILICNTKVSKQAREKGHSTQKEFVILFIHGVFHLLGYDHEVEREAVIMEGLEKKILDKLYR